MEHEFWRARWEQGQIGFHEASTHRFLLRYGPKIRALGERVFVPLCGKSRDLDALAAMGFRVTGCEFVEQAVRDYFRERGDEAPATRAVGDQTEFSSPSAEGVHIVCGDVFTCTPPDAPFDAAFDRAALVALRADQRDGYLRKLASVTRAGGAVLLVSVEHDLGSGPPFEVTRSELERLSRGLFTVDLLASEDATESNARFVDRGATYVREAAYLLTRAD